ncbi:NB-ARC - like 10 [Theobroma cacao]|nr:NB-ARC - like 10 [Theobroma cacao]
MDVGRIFAIDVLKEKEAWDLFKKMAGDDVENPELRSVATEVAKKCEGLPVAIVTVARALRSKELYAWKDALAQLQRPSTSDRQSGIPAADPNRRQDGEAAAAEWNIAERKLH